MRLYQTLASKVCAYHNCLDRPEMGDWEARHGDDIKQLAKNFLPSGSGFDSGTEVDLDRSTGEKLVVSTSFHHMDEHGGYDGWTEHTVTVRPSLQHGFLLTIGGRDRNGIKDYIGEVFNDCLDAQEEAAA